MFHRNEQDREGNSRINGNKRRSILPGLFTANNVVRAGRNVSIRAGQTFSKKFNAMFLHRLQTDPELANQVFVKKPSSEDKDEAEADYEVMVLQFEDEPVQTDEELFPQFFRSGSNRSSPSSSGGSSSSRHSSRTSSMGSHSTSRSSSARSSVSENPESQSSNNQGGSIAETSDSDSEQEVSDTNTSAGSSSKHSPTTSTKRSTASASSQNRKTSSASSKSSSSSRSRSSSASSRSRSRSGSSNSSSSASSGEQEVNGTLKVNRAIGIINVDPAFRWCTVSTQGRREYMEDRDSHTVGVVEGIKAAPRARTNKSSATKLRGGTLHHFGVFDGHGGAHCSQLCKETVCQKMLQGSMELFAQLEPGATEPRKEDVHKLFDKVFVETDEKYCLDAVQRGSDYEDGTTATVLQVYIPDVSPKRTRKAICHLGAVGDSRALLIQTAKSMKPFGGEMNSSSGESSDEEDNPLSWPAPEVTVLNEDHDASLESEKKRVEAMGGTIAEDSSGGARVIGPLGDSLAVTRSIGDVYFSKYVTANPDVKSWTNKFPPLVDGKKDMAEIRKKEWWDATICLASDGIWGWVNNEEVGEIVTKHRCSKTICRCSALKLKVSKVQTWCTRCCAKEIILTAFNRGSNDNITITILDLEALVNQPNTLQRADRRYRKGVLEGLDQAGRKTFQKLVED